MLHIKNREELQLRQVIVTKQNLYYVEGVYEYKDHYGIHIRSYKNTILDELLILLRNRKEDKENGIVYKYYDMYDSNRPECRVGLTPKAIQNKDTLIKGIVDILTMQK